MDESLIGALPVLPGGHRFRIKKCRYQDYHYGTYCDLEIIIQERLFGIFWLNEWRVCLYKLPLDKAEADAKIIKTAKQAAAAYEASRAKRKQIERVTGVY